MLAVTGATGHLADRGGVVREGGYGWPETLGPALDGVDRLLLISGNETGRRVAQHQLVIDAAQEAGVGLVAYTSILHADTSEIGLAEEHRQTEALLDASGIPHVVLRNGWYTENYTGSIGAALEHGAVLGSAGDARISAASRKDFAEAAAVVLTSDEDQAGRTYELAGPSFTMTEYAAELTRQSGTPVNYVDMTEEGYRDALIQAGLPEPVAAMLAQSDAAARQGALEGSPDDLEGLLNRTPTPMPDVVAEALAARGDG
ncbi:SDR family oxidoreductase [Rubrivirga marina]|uniref:NAD(P)-dependent oxidoreductase n=1 Tax=Rubrivirga marina TaxID=1196024 RepID=A0A271IV69_9BACT|nr:SDR family oxidoreductase [Rubrivirga marina]PAP75113.1 NAD(P)-dependent oxidoreductase [Rubrivirga marina]